MSFEEDSIARIMFDIFVVKMRIRSYKKKSHPFQFLNPIINVWMRRE
jgi:hypothetical protein